MSAGASDGLGKLPKNTARRSRSGAAVMPACMHSCYFVKQSRGRPGSCISSTHYTCDDHRAAQRGAGAGIGRCFSAAGKQCTRNCRGSGHRAAPSMESWPSRPVLKINCVPFATWSFSSRLVVPSFFTARQQGRERVFSR